MNLPAELRQRLQFLARVVAREVAHAEATDQRLFAAPFTRAQALALRQDADLAERVDAFVSRFGRLQDTVGDKLLPAWLTALGEPVGPMMDNLDRAERWRIIDSAEQWMALRQLRNRMVHDYIEDPAVLADALQTAHAHLHLLAGAARALLADLARRGLIAEH